LPKAGSLIRSLHKSKANATELFESNELATLRMSHKIDELKVQQQNFFASFNNNTLAARSRSEEAPVRPKGHNARINLFNNIFRQKLEAKYTKPALLKEGLDYYVKNFSESLFVIFSKYIFCKLESFVTQIKKSKFF